jgi:hypothetical protein
MPLSSRPPSRPRAAVFYSGYGYGFCVGDIATDREVAGPFETLDLAWAEARARGYSVVDVLRTRATFKHQKRSTSSLPGPA